MTRGRPNIFIVVSLLVVVAGGLFVARVLVKPSHRLRGTESGEPTPAAPEQAAGSPGQGQVRLAIAVPADSGFTSISYAVISPGHVVVARANAAVEKQTGVAAPAPIALPGGARYTLSVVGNTEAGGIKRAIYLGSSAFDAVAGRETAVAFAPGPGIDRAPGESAAATTAGAPTSANSSVACQSCELSSGQGICESANITATSSTDPRTGEQTGIGWGCQTLGEPKARSACLALLHCLNVNDCGHPGENPVTGCYCGAAPAQACIGGQGLSGACIAEYQAAAVASAGGPGSGAGDGQLSQFIATAAGDPTTPIGLANNIKHCASETHCDACQSL